MHGIRKSTNNSYLEFQIEAADRAAMSIQHMNGENQEFSYANNSFLQEFGIRKMHRIMKQTIYGIANLDGFPHCFNIADLGCSSGQNTLLVVSNIINEVRHVCQEKNIKSPQFQVWLNDLYGNDFNSIFKSLPMFYDKYNKETGNNVGQCFIYGVPGSFYGRLFPDKSMHLCHSSSSLNWLSQLPEGLVINGLNVYLAKTSPPIVFDMYRMQFQKDFTMFLESRSKEMIQGGHMVLSIAGRSNEDPSCNDSGGLWGLFARSLVDVAEEGLVKYSDIESFNVPTYNPYRDEVTDLIQKEGSFSLDLLDSYKVNWDPYDTDYASVKVTDDKPTHGQKVANILRAAAEPMLIAQFGNSAMDLVFQKFEGHVNEHLATEKTKHHVIILSLTKIYKL